ncbi:DUF2268 domain-containing putative Zn-dependent protease [Citromicrobium bathyomarinum]|uniref:DUF2268 domain-containing putative Zn-dependent protease n=1 Tax=Citromicrobium bathyomarinum TaxID=72174 RepID=UPI00315B1DC7
MVRKLFPALLALGLAHPALAQQAAPERAPDANPLTATIHLEDVARFVAVFRESGGNPTAEQLQQRYLEPGSLGVRVFIPYRIVSAENLAAAIADDPSRYAEAIDRCLPLVRKADKDLRSIYLGLHGAFPEARLPQIYIVFGAGTSGGTAKPGAQVLGLEVLCAISPDDEAFRTTLRHFFAHETVHSLQGDYARGGIENPLLKNVLMEGAADFIAALVTGETPDASRAQWAEPKEAELRAMLSADIALIDRALSDPSLGGEANAAYLRWIGNYGEAPEGWPNELGYWMGMRIWEDYYAAAPDKHAALLEMLALSDPGSVLAAADFSY